MINRVKWVVGLLAISFLLIVPILNSSYYIHTLGSHRDDQETREVIGTLKWYEDHTGWKPLRMFPKDKKVYRIRISNWSWNNRTGDSYEFFVSLPESPRSYIGKRIKLTYNKIKNVFGNTVMVEASEGPDFPLPGIVGLPIYGKIDHLP